MKSNSIARSKVVLVSQARSLMFFCCTIVILDFQFRTERIVFLGDSLTYAGSIGDGYICRLENRLQAEGLNENYELIGKGIGGNMVRHLLARFEQDVVALKPTKVILLVGINDVGFYTWHPEEGGTPHDQYESAITYMVQRMKEKGIQPVICTPTVVEENRFAENSLDSRIDEYATICRRVAKKNRVPLCDLRKAFTTYLKRNNTQNTEKVLTNDYVHMNPKGDSLIAHTLYPFIIE